MIHGPCGEGHPSCACMVNGECSKNYPKEYCEKTTILQNGHVRYARPKNRISTKKNGVAVDNAFVVLHNVDLCVKYQAHINVERVSRDGMEKYLFKYFTKGFDCSKVGLQRKRASGESSTCTKGVNEIQDYLECRCIAPNDAAWRLLQFEIHHTNPSVERLPVHLPLGNSVVYNEDDSLEQVLQNPWNQITKLTAWFEANKTYPEAVCYTYAEFPEHFTWHADGKYWDYRRGTGNVGRLANVGPNQGDSYYLRMLLHIVKGARSYSEIRTIEGQQYPTFQAACQAPGLLGDDREWLSAIVDAAHWALPYQLHELFVTLLLFCNVTDPLALFEEHFSRMGEDYMHRIGHSMTDHSTPFTQHVRSFVLAEIDKLLRNSGYSLPHFNLPEPILTSACAVGNRLLTDEQAYDIDRISVEAAEQLDQLNLNQKHVYDVVLQSVNNCIGHTFFVHGYGGTGKTFLWNALLNAVRTQGKIALTVASSGIAALLLPGGHTPHSRFKIPLDIQEHSLCAIKKKILI
ncbi:uncharacterized protein LOC127772754 [Oryza glaberrima]|uniref:uncharacterized protein LOC127772754 n=1 Tax=Oryza glaberrima TaxID=4538 RepID=UPI00224C09B7|nr:uncharacterized protein LOC127772754 [Oryza glaberrima]XP_052154686.1 uncharacterized protein LOC127772754 [Oryza glaberrima]XP_052154694.1 uncharacterized protein LOC127772754 [Oryza glaberrima]XP_052154702.1 uncharacterized protein LOC127772754 [Oryza glaberrima]XP_052154710.1 uncharacterized protein LOC127772754 [Oryza glaberrima]XP_052154718.1 uncharacterized protein LOC127772754 [Oryza glaberrima]XP_052154727.1 uncharacterized protein LOC127772754 [Oryza glaberrima]XP_052154734.1 unc